MNWIDVLDLYFCGSRAQSYHNDESSAPACNSSVLLNPMIWQCLDFASVGPRYLTNETQTFRELEGDLPIGKPCNKRPIFVPQGVAEANRITRVRAQCPDNCLGLADFRRHLSL